MSVVLVATACTGDGDATPQPTVTSTSSTVATATTPVPEFTGDPDSAFCQLVREAEDRPVLDPFEPGQAPRDVQVRFLALRNRFAEFRAVAPAELVADLDQVLDALDELEAVLAAADWDFTAVPEGTDLSVFDDPAFTDVGARLSAYQEQVCSS